MSSQFVNRSLKGDRLTIKHPQANREAPAQTNPIPKIITNCKLPIDVAGRCLANNTFYHKIV